MKLLFLADSVYSKHNSDYYGLRVYGKEFFEDYLEVFTSVTVCARISHITSAPLHSPTQTDRITFVDLPNIHGMQWLLGGNREIQGIIRNAVASCDAVVCRVPSTTGSISMPWSKKLGKPFLAEVVGDPWDSVSGYGKGLIYKIAGLWYYYRFRRFMQNVNLASYVSRRVLQSRYPAHLEAQVEEYSSIRLESRLVCNPRQYSAPPIPLKILCLQAFLGYKRHIDLVDACKSLKAKAIPFQLNFVGEGPLQDSIRQKIESLGMANDAVFHGYISNRDSLLAILDACHVAVVPSGQEGLPRALLEAMARGLGGIGSDIGGVPDLVRSTECFPVGNSKRLSEILVDVAGDSERLTQMSVHAVEKSKSYTQEVLRPRRLRMYRALANAVKR